MRRFITAAMAASLASSACAADEAAFRPTTHVTASGHAGQPAASYDVRADTSTVAHVNVWSRGAYRAEDGRTIIRLVADIQNTGDRTVRLRRDDLRLEAFRRSGSPLGRPRLIRGFFELDRPIPAGDGRTVELHFAMPAPIDPDSIGGLRMRWGLGYDDGQRYVQFTEFQRVPEPVHATGVVVYDPVFGFYDPYLYGPPYVHHLRHHVPVRRVIVQDRERDRRSARRAERRGSDR
jgi:hypothetical protein